MADITATPNPAPAGGMLLICYDDANRADQMVTIEMDNGEGQSDSYALSLDEDGHGCFSWQVPAWDIVQINGPNAVQETVVVN